MECVECHGCKERKSLKTDQNIDAKSFDKVWTIFSRGLSVPMFGRCSTLTFEKLSDLARLTYRQIPITYWQLYLITKPQQSTTTDECNRLLQQKSTALLISLLWGEVSQWSGMLVENSEAAHHFGQLAIQRGLSTLEHDAQLLFNPNHDIMAINQLLHEYGLDLNPTTGKRPKFISTPVAGLHHIYHLLRTQTYNWPWLLNMKNPYSLLEPATNFTKDDQDNLVENDDVSKGTIPKHVISWNLMSYPVNGSGLNVTIKEGDMLLFVNDDALLHNLIETNDQWQPLADPEWQVGPHTLKKFTISLGFPTSGKYYLRCNVYPDIIRLTVTVSEMDNTKPKPIVPKLPTEFNRVLRSRKLINYIQVPGYHLTEKFQHQMRRWLLAEAVLRELAWGQLRAFTFKHQAILVQSLNLEQLAVIYRSQSLCDLINIGDKTPVWETLITDIGDLLLSRALQEIGHKSRRTKSSSHLENIHDSGNIDGKKDKLRHWYHKDRDYALVALCNVLQDNGRVAVNRLQLQITSRCRALGLTARSTSSYSASDLPPVIIGDGTAH